MIWKSLVQCQYDLSSWGWEMKNGVLAPVMTDLDPAPEDYSNLYNANAKLRQRTLVVRHCAFV